jgi:hypothetical protein
LVLWVKDQGIQGEVIGHKGLPSWLNNLA